MTVVVTGVGLVCPAGIGLDASLERLAQGPLEPEVPPAEALPSPAVLRVPATFDPKRYARRRKDLKLMARANQLAVAAARLAVADAGLTDADLGDAGLYLGVGLEPGNLDDVVQPVLHSLVDGRIDLDRLVSEGMRRMHPLSSLKTLPNMSVAHVSIALGIMGPSMALCAGPDAGMRALIEGVHALHEGKAEVVLVGAADAKVAFPDRVSALRNHAGDAPPVAEAAAILVLERADRAESRIKQTFDHDPPAAAQTKQTFVSFDAGAATALVQVALDVPRRAPAVIVRRAQPMAVAITGVGLTTPLGNDLSTFADALFAGTSAASPISAFDASRFPVRNACEATLQAWPDALAERMRGLDDRKGELALAAAAAAIADRGEVPSDTGVVYATGLSSVSVAELHQDCAPFVRDGDFDYAAFAAAEDGGPRQAPRRHQVDRPVALLREHFGLSGVATTHFSACAAGTAAVGHAADLIRRGESSVVLAGAGDSMVHPFGMLPFILLGATSTEVDPGRVCRPFDADRDGFVMGEGGAFFVLEPVERARAEGRRIYGTVLGWGSSTDAYSVTAPHPEGAGAERAMRAALAEAGLARVDYVNAHGTGTPLNDVTEAAAIRRVFGAGTPPVSSSKAQLGHAIAAAGALELLGCLAALDRGVMPPNAHLETPDPKVDLDLVGRIGRPAPLGVVLSNSFGFGGQNASLVVAHRDWDGV